MATATVRPSRPGVCYHATSTSLLTTPSTTRRCALILVGQRSSAEKPREIRLIRVWNNVPRKITLPQPCVF